MKSKLFVVAIGLCWACAGNALDAIGTSLEFHDLLVDSLTKQQQNSPYVQYLQLLPDKQMAKAWLAPSLSRAVEDTRSERFDALAGFTRLKNQAPPAARDLNEVLRRHPLTIVIFPGLLSEFVRDQSSHNRIFSDVMRNNSTAREYSALVSRELAKQNPDASDTSYSLAQLQNLDLPLDQYVQVSSIDDAQGRPLIRLVVLNSPLGSLETIGDLTENAGIMKRRLEKYLRLTGDQDLILLGHSRGATYELEVLTEAQREDAAWLSDVRAVTSLSGVLWGSTIADQAFNPQAPLARAIDLLRDLNANLEATNGDLLHDTQVHINNTLKRLQFKTQLLPLAGSLNESLDLIRAAGNISLGAGFMLVMKAYSDLNLGLWSDDPDSLKRSRLLFDKTVQAIDQLTTAKRVEWWKSHTVPDSPLYLSLAAAMPNPNDSAESKMAFDNPLAFGFNNSPSFEDELLLQNRIQYEHDSGLSLNDSQVAVPQTMFLPNAITALNPGQPPIRAEFLGILGTHHWGEAYPVVFDEYDKRTNGFPREAMLKALAAKVAADLD